MGELRFISGEAALRTFIAKIQGDAIDRLDDRNINSSGRLKRSTTTEVRIGFGSSEATLFALEYWKQAGSGSPPGTKTDPFDLAQWARDKGLANNDRAALKLGVLVSRKIERSGSKDFREGNPNVYIEAIEANADMVPEVLSAFLRDIPSALVSEFKRFAS